MSYHCYLVECRDGTLYCGIAKDVARRVKEHNNGSKGARYTRSRRPVAFVASVGPMDVGAALRLERLVKSKPKAVKLKTLGEYNGRATG